MIWFVLILATGIISFVDIYLAVKFNHRLSKYHRLYDPSQSESVQGYVFASLVPIANLALLIRTSILIISNKLSPNPNR